MNGCSMKLAFSTNAFKPNTLDEAIGSIAAAGYAGVELMADLHHAYPPSLSAAARRELIQRIADAGLQPSNVNAFTLFMCGDTYHPTWIEHDPIRRQERVNHTLACIELAAAIGATTVSLQPGGPLIGLGLNWDQAAERFAESLGKTIAAARSTGVTLAIEPEPGLLIESADEYLRFKRRFFANEPAVKMNCDIGHLFCVGDDPAAVIRALPADIAHVHVEDIGANRVHQHLTPGRGVIDFDAVFSALTDIGYTGWTTVELYPYEGSAGEVARAAYDYLSPE